MSCSILNSFNYKKLISSIKITCMKNSINIGKLGEEKAVKFLQEKGYKIIKRNIRFKKIEIDILAEYSDLIIVCEVKWRSNTDFFQISKNQINNIKNYIETFLNNKKVRFDVIIINKNIIEHIEGCIL